MVAIGDLQILSNSEEIFNHVDENLYMWSETGDRSLVKKIVFERPFTDVPAVSFGLSGIDSSCDQNLRFNLRIKGLTRTGFNIEFVTWGDTHIARASVSWHAIGRARARRGTTEETHGMAPPVATDLKKLFTDSKS